MGGGHGRGWPRHPLIMKVLAALRHLGKGDDFESLEDQCQISETVLKTFVPKFTSWFKATIWRGRVFLISR